MDKTKELNQLCIDYTKAVKELQAIQKMEDEKKKEVRQIIQKVIEVAK